MVSDCPSGLLKSSSEPTQYSKSPEVLACLQRCASALALADKGLHSLTNSVRSLSVSPRSSSAQTPDPETRMSGRTRQCHGCHGPIDASHKGYPTGADRCTLEHDDRCEGGIAEGVDRFDRKWRSCPAGYILVEDDLYEDQDFTGGEGLGFLDDRHVENNYLTSGLASLSLASQSSVRDLPLPLAAALGSETSAVVSSSSMDTTTITSAPQTVVTSLGLGLASQTVVTSSMSGLATSAQEGDLVSDQVASARSRLLALKKKRQDLEVLAELQREEQHEAAQTRQLQQQLQLSQHVGHPKVGEGAARLRARNQTFDHPVENQGYYSGPTMPQIRNVSGLPPVVDNRVNQVRFEVPSLARRPNATLGGPQQTTGIRARSASTARQRSRDVAFDPVGVQRSQNQQSFVHDLIDIDDQVRPSLTSNQPLGRGGQPRRSQVDLLSEDPQTDPSDEEEEGQTMKLVYRRDQHGQKYRTWEPVRVETSPAIFEWVTDARTGRQYKQQMQADHSSHQQELRGHRSGSFTAGMRSSHHQQVSYERTPTFVSIPNSEKEGKSEAKQSIVDWARKCPVLWAEKVNHDSMNAIVWLWGYLSEILAAKTDNALTLDAGVLEAKLQHALCVLEVCATHSEKTDFDTQGWKIARLYARKVQAQLDRDLVSWSDFAEFKANPHPSELIAAKQELEQKLRPRKKFGEDRDKPKGDRFGDRPLCTAWNSSKVEGKCDWQTKNPDKGRCNRRHDCSYCSEKGHGTLHHQRSFCARRIAAGDA